MLKSRRQNATLWFFLRRIHIPSGLLCTPNHANRYKYYRDTCKTREGQRPRCPIRHHTGRGSVPAARDSPPYGQRGRCPSHARGFASASIISVLVPTNVGTVNDLRGFVPICGHGSSKTKLAGQTPYPTCQSLQSAVCFYLIPNFSRMNSKS